jgi:predicted P-loop ATPase
LLESPQGWEKSNGIKALVGVEYHSDQSVWRTRDTKRQMEMMEGVVIFELGELQGLSEANIDEIKTFASRTIDADRMAYGRFKD